jgi:hypothetical protein
MPKKKEKTESIDSKEDAKINCRTITKDEIEEWIITIRKVLIVLAEESKEKYEKIYQDFIYDLQELKDAGRITEDNYEDILENL